MPLDPSLLKLYLDEHDELVSQYGNYYGYYLGSEQQVKLTDRARKFLEANGFEEFRTNVCEVVVDSMAYRLFVTNFASPDDFDDWAWMIWTLGGLNAEQYTLYRYTLAMGDGYLVGEWYRDPVTGLEYPRWRFNDPRNCYMVYEDDDTAQPICFLKRWMRRGETAHAPGPWRLNVYFPDHIDKYDGPLGITSEGADWKFLGAEGWPTGAIPVVHFANRKGADSYGRSELSNVVPHQDGLNKMWVDLMTILDQQGWPQRYATGAEEPEGGWSSQPGVTWTGPTDAQFGQFAAANPVGVLKAIEAGYSAVASISRTPQHAFHTPGDRFPSGEALKTAEAGLIEKCEAFVNPVSNRWEEAMRISAKMQEAHGKWPPPRPEAQVKAEEETRRKQLESQVSSALPGALPGAMPGVPPPRDPEPVKKVFGFTAASSLECQWRDLETRNELMQINAISLKAQFISERQVLRELGYSDEDINRILMEKAEDQEKKQLQLVQQQPVGVKPLNPNAAVQPGLKSSGQQTQPTSQPARPSAE